MYAPKQKPPLDVALAYIGFVSPFIRTKNKSTAGSDGFILFHTHFTFLKPSVNISKALSYNIYTAC